jgi:hypothetical protein
MHRRERFETIRYKKIACLNAGKRLAKAPLGEISLTQLTVYANQF